jgi:hypothetical protein
MRRILLVGLAPLISLSALAAAASAGPEVAAASSSKDGSNVLIGWLRSVVYLAAPAAEYTAPVSPEHPSPQAVLTFAALAGTPYRHSVWLIARAEAVNFAARHRLRTLLRC